MEALLNFFWLLIALGAFAWWRRRVKRSVHKARGSCRAFSPLLALVCALAILFPAISVTDDLHPALFIVEDSSASRRSVALVAGSHGDSHYGVMASPPALVSESLQADGGSDVLEVLHGVESFCPDGAQPLAASQRAPPLS